MIEHPLFQPYAITHQGRIFHGNVSLATHIRSNIRELEGSLNRVCAYASLTSQPITIELIRKVLRSFAALSFST